MKIIVWKKKAAVLLAAALAAGMAGYAATYPAVAYATDRQLPIYSVDKGQQKVCSISFDAAWGNVRLRPLRRQDFSVLKHVPNRPEHAKRRLSVDSRLSVPKKSFPSNEQCFRFFPRCSGQ